MTDEIPEWMRTAQEGEMRMRLQCNLCGTIQTIAIVIPEHLRDKVAEIIKGYPDDMLMAARAMAGIAADWVNVSLPDGGEVDICPDCQEKSPFVRGGPDDEL